jgi:hypothetical protein
LGQLRARTGQGKTMSLRKWRRLAILVVALAIAVRTAWAQHGYVSAPMLDSKQAHSLDAAILVIAIPPLAIFIGILFYFYRRGSRSRNP